MKSHTQVAVIGGGVVGASVLYHLTKAGWTDAVLLERGELTCGSTWHAAGGMHTLNGDPNVAKLQKYTIELYKEIETVSGVSCGLHMPGGLMLAGTQARMDWLRGAVAKGRYLGMDAALIPIEEAHRMLPLIDKSRFVGALWDPLDGHVDPYGVTQAYARCATMAGAEIVRHTRVTALSPRPDGGWDIETEKGRLVAGHVVNAGGLWAREVGRMVGLELPLLAMEHQYLITEDVPHLLPAHELPHTIDFEGEIYLRQERQGVLLGTYEQGGVPWSRRSAPWDFAAELLPPDLDRIAGNLQTGFEHFPALADAGIRKVVNGPFTFAPDGNPLIGPVRGLRNFWVACGVMAGFSQGGGVGLALANWMTQGDPGFDIWAMDVARYGGWATPAYTEAKVRENYGRRFRVTFPNEELPAARPLRTSPLFQAQQADGAVFGASWGLEYPQWFAPPGERAEEDVTFRRSNAHGPVGAEVRAVRESVGLIETTSYARYEFTGPGAESFLDRMLAGRMPQQGRLALSPMLNGRGKLIGDFTVAKLDGTRFHVFGSGPAEDYHLRWWEAHLPASGVAVRPLREWAGLSIAGPSARALLAAVTEDETGPEALPFLAYRRVQIGTIPAWTGRISFTGSLGYEIWVESDRLLALHRLLCRAGADFGLRNFGMRALNAMRLEKSYGTWAREYRPVYGPYAAGLGRFVALGKGFIGRDAALQEKQDGPAQRLVTLTVDADGADALGDEPVLLDGRTVGWVTSGGYGHSTGASIALAYVEAGCVTPEAAFQVEILGDMRPARLAPQPLYDPDGAVMRG